MTAYEKRFSLNSILDDAVLRAFLSRQVVQLKIGVSIEDEEEPKTVVKIFALILSLCEDLIDMVLCSPLLMQECWIFVTYLLPTKCTCATLTRLQIDVLVGDRLHYFTR